MRVSSAKGFQFSAVQDLLPIAFRILDTHLEDIERRTLHRHARGAIRRADRADLHSGLALLEVRIVGRSLAREPGVPSRRYRR